MYLRHIQALRGFSTLMILAVHLREVERKTFADPWLPDWVVVGASAVDMFFVVSGFIMTYLAVGQFGSAAKMSDFLYRRVSRIYPPYWVYTLMVIPVLLLQPGWVNAAGGGGQYTSLFFSFTLLPHDRPPLIPVAWTLSFEMYFYVVFSFLLLLPERALPKMLALWAAVQLVLIALAFPVREATPWMNLLGSPMCLEFLMGCVVGLLILRGQVVWPGTMLLLSILLLAVGQWLYFSVTQNHWVDDYSRLFLYGVPAALAVYGAVGMERSGVNRAPRPLLAAGDASYSIYLTHVPVLSAAGRLCAALGLESPVAHALWIVGSTAVAVFGGLVSYRIIELPLVRLTRAYTPSAVRARRVRRAAESAAARESR